MSSGELRTLQIPVMVLLVVVLAAAGAVYYTDGLLMRARQQLAQQQALLRDARNQLYQSGEEREIINRYLDRYLALQRIGFVGEEQRINWLDGLRIANERTNLFGVDYQISEQRPYPYASELDRGQLTLHQSVMKLRFGLLHEGDLMRFFQILGQTGAGVFSIDQCTVARGEFAGPLRHQPNLRAECELSWITARPPVGEKKS